MSVLVVMLSKEVMKGETDLGTDDFGARLGPIQSVEAVNARRWLYYEITAGGACHA